MSRGQYTLESSGMVLCIYLGRERIAEVVNEALAAELVALANGQRWRQLGEGPFDTQEQAEDFRDAEVGVVARVRQTEAGWIIETLEYE
jgi:hypothetical protein